jgi:hypothetical protein
MGPRRVSLMSRPSRDLRGRPLEALRNQRRRLRVGLSLGAALVLLALAVAGPPDALWIGGLYDGGDSDELVALGADGGPPPLVPVVAAPGRLSRAFLTAETTGAAASVAPAGSPRAPPAS